MMRNKAKMAALAFMVFAALAVFCGSNGLKAAEFSSPSDAQQQGISAYKGGYYELAIPALEFAASHNMFLAQYYLGKLYADNNSPHTDHPKAYILFQTIANNYANADPEDRTKAPYVAHSLTALAGYLMRGLPEIAVKSDATRAAEYLRHAALFFNDEDAQFELAKLHLRGEGVKSDVARGKHWLAILAQKGHAGAQAFLADLYWRGLYVRKDPVRALALISVALKNTPPKDRVWIEDVYQNIYCGASKGVRKQVEGGMVAQWDKRYGRKPALERDTGLGLLSMETQRVCQDGLVPPLLKQGLEPGDRQEKSNAISADAGAGAVTNGDTTSVPSTAGAVTHGFSHGSMLGGAGGIYRNVGEHGLGSPER